MKKIVLLLLLVLTFSACEKDDVCDETASVTPRVILEFYDFSQPTVLKNVSNLEAHATDENENDTLKIFTAVSKIELPLNPIAATTTYTLNLNSTIPASKNTDIITFNYTTKQVYISRACGFKNIYKLNPLNGVITSDGTPNDGIWIKEMDVITNNIVDENEVHIKIYF